MRRPFVAGNWKMHLDREGAVALARALREELAADAASLAGTVTVAVFPAFPFLEPVRAALEGTAIAVGAQDCHFEPEGAYTGAVSAPMLASIGCRHAIVGHSERRREFGETDETVNLKLKAVLGAGLAAILCVGETLDEREGGRTIPTVSNQLALALEGVTAHDVARLAVAYEPVWAIGTGRNATPAQAEEVHRFVRDTIASRFGRERGDAVQVLYGGSVKAENAAELLAEKNVDGALVGGASLKAKGFAAIVRAAAAKSPSPPGRGSE